MHLGALSLRFLHRHWSRFWTLSPNQQPEDHPEQANTPKQRKGDTPSNNDDHEGQCWRKDCWPNGAAEGDDGQAKHRFVGKVDGSKDKQQHDHDPTVWRNACASLVHCIPLCYCRSLPEKLRTWMHLVLCVSSTLLPHSRR